MCQNNSQEIEIYPSNWLYNAGVVGFLSCLDREDYLSEDLESKYEIKENGGVSIRKEVFQNIKIDENYFEDGHIVNLKGNNLYYPNFIDSKGAQKEVFRGFVRALGDSEKTKQSVCSLCNSGINVEKNKIENGIDIKQRESFFIKISHLNMVHTRFLGPAKEFPNAYWNLKSSLKLCHLCNFLLIHHHLSFTKLSDGSEIFINAPSFRLMYELNRVVRDLFGKEDVEPLKKREILAMSIVEFSRKLQTTLGQWNAMNIELITKKGGFIDFYTLPYETVNIISDRTIASLLSDIGEISILENVLNGTFQTLLEISQHLIKISLKTGRDKSDTHFINTKLKKDFNRNNINLTSQKILKLYANIKDRRILNDRTN